MFDAVSLRFTYVNEGAMQQTGYTQQELLGMHAYDLKPEYSEAGFRMLISTLLSGELPSLNFETIHVHKNGQQIPVDIFLQYVTTGNEQSSFVAIVRDITERTYVENELEGYRGVLETLVDERTSELSAARDEAERSSHAKSEFLSRMSHELRTPLNAILGFGQMLELDEADFNETQNENVQEILRAGEHLLALISDVLDLSKIESGKLDISMENVQINDLLSQCISLIQPLADERKVEVVNRISDNHCIVQADGIRLKQILVNLLSNAVKYNRENGFIMLDSELTDNQHIRLRVTDRGVGMSENDIAKLFSPFERLDQKNNVEGTGIGLVICKYLAELMGGTIGVESSPGTGSTFWVELVLVNEN
jgi:PAS domain S-box-containing protein